MAKLFFKVFPIGEKNLPHIQLKIPTSTKHLLPAFYAKH
jgi:hypothetical protein